jgi:hypothetical protein
MMRTRVLAVLAFTALVAPFGQAIEAQHAPQTKLFIHTGPDPYGYYQDLRYGGNNWKAMTTLLQGTFNITTGFSLPSLATLNQYDALWIDQRYGTQPTAADLNAMLAFAATGRRVVIVGENSYPGDLNFFNWSSPYVQALGGTQGAGSYVFTPSKGPGTNGHDSRLGCVYGEIKSIYKHELAWGVEKVNTGCAGYAVGGTALFNYNAITLWGAPQNVLTILDTNILDDYFGSYAQSPKFRTNLVNWLDDSEGTLMATATVVPEPGTFALFAPALLGVGALVRSRKTRG